jgi:hypothetical protein
MDAKSAVKSAVKFVVQVGSVNGAYATVYETDGATVREKNNALSIYMNPMLVGAPDGMGMKKRLLAVGPDGEVAQLASSLVELF